MAAKRPGGERPARSGDFSPPPALRADPPLAGRDETTHVASVKSDTCHGAYAQASIITVAPGTGSGEGTSIAENGTGRPPSLRSQTL